MQFKRISQAITLLGLGLAATLLLAPRQAQAQWTATVGAQSPDQGQQALAFLPNEFWIHAGDTITWTSESDEIHTVTFLTASQKIPSFTAGCPGFAPGDAGIFDGSTCLSTQPITQGQTFKVTFPQAGTYKLICLVHNTMNATIHVLEVSAPLPHDQDFYDRTAASERRALLTDRDLGMAMGRQGDGDHDGDDGMTMQVLPATRHVT
ncbi:MAG: cupredoxin domain-containing protein, partial [Terriglobales bacterium]